MKIIGLMLLVTTFVACDPHGFGFKKNPAYVLDEAFTAIQNNDESRLLEVTGKEALCVYGNQASMQYLKESLVLNVENAKMIPVVLNAKHYSIPQFVGFWSYYSERYQVDVQDKTSEEILLRAIIDCNFGKADKDEKLLRQDPRKYKMKECRLTKFIPRKFSPLPISEKCLPLQVDL